MGGGSADGFRKPNKIPPPSMAQPETRVMGQLLGPLHNRDGWHWFFGDLAGLRCALGLKAGGQGDVKTTLVLGPRKIGQERQRRGEAQLCGKALGLEGSQSKG